MVRKAKTAAVFPNAIEIVAWGKRHFFASFLSRDEAYRLIILNWSQHSGYAKLFLGVSTCGVRLRYLCVRSKLAHLVLAEMKINIVLCEGLSGCLVSF